MNENYLFFWRGSLSQWKFSPFTQDGIRYFCMEQYMMAQKALLFNDNIIYDAIMRCDNPKQCKHHGRQVRNFDESVWNSHKYEIVRNGNYLKFTQNPNLAQELVATSPKILVEANPYDRVWSCGLTEELAKLTPPDKWPGENLLGKALTEVRDILLHENSFPGINL